MSDEIRFEPLPDLGAVLEFVRALADRTRLWTRWYSANRGEDNDEDAARKEDAERQELADHLQQEFPANALVECVTSKTAILMARLIAGDLENEVPRQMGLPPLEVPAHIGAWVLFLVTLEVHRQLSDEAMNSARVLSQMTCLPTLNVLKGLVASALSASRGEWPTLDRGDLQTVNSPTFGTVLSLKTGGVEFVNMMNYLMGRSSLQ